MTNKEFYSDKLLAAALTRDDGCKLVHELEHGKSCHGVVCFDCELYTIEGMCEWLNAEHVEPEPPLLKNGDGLKPGDWIMVRNSEGEEWVERQFAFSHNGWFYCLRGGSNFAQLHLTPLLRYEQARLPEEGETR